ncbi:MAG TPA: hypothetical protein VFV10_06270 [Gammaproteobacteria bacterium]|nr:hypothetical protein [Gammaproteobacteria bacterium]
MTPATTLLADLDAAAAADCVARYGAALVRLPRSAPILGSYWGAPEAGLVGGRIYVRDDTPAHSLLHELGHYVCMTPERRARLDRDAGGDDAEESAVCYLQVLLADRLPGFGGAKALADMDAWGYSFREGGAAAWFAGDGRFAREWLLGRGLIDAGGLVTWRLRGDFSAQSCVGFGASP